MLNLQRRDQELLRFCYEHQYLLMDHVLAYFFEGKTYQSAWTRIRKLEHAGLVKWETLTGLGSKRVVRLTKDGIKIVESENPIRVKQQKQIPLATLAHDTLVTSVRGRLTRLWEATWLPEGALKKDEFIEVPDGVLVFPDDKRIAVEVERTPKGRTRFMGLLNRWRKIDVLLVLYVVDSPHLCGILQTYLTEGPRDVAFGLVRWDALKRGKPLIWTPAGEMDLFSSRGFQ